MRSRDVEQCLFLKKKRIGLIYERTRNLILIKKPEKTGTPNNLDLKGLLSNERYQVARMSRIRKKYINAT